MVLLFHRRIELHEDHLIRPFQPQLIAPPALLRVPCDITQEELEEEVWRQAQRFTTRSEGSGSCFVLRRVDRMGIQCPSCLWIRYCPGCVFGPTDRVSSEVPLAVDWHFDRCNTESNTDSIMDSSTADSSDTHSHTDPSNGPSNGHSNAHQGKSEKCWSGPGFTFSPTAAFARVMDKSVKMEHSRRSSAACTFAECLEEFTTCEELEQASVYCSTCKKFETASKTLTLWSTPNVLVLHLKRLLPGRKLFTMVDFPLVGFDPSPFLPCLPKETQCGNEGGSGNPNLYNLFAVVNHIGYSHGGHYVAYALNRVTGKWYLYDDSHCMEVGNDNIVTPNAYMLFYERQGLSSLPALSFLPKHLRSLVNEELEEDQFELQHMAEQEATGGWMGTWGGIGDMTSNCVLS